MHKDNWVSVHVFFHGDLNRVIIGAVSALVGEAEAAVLCTNWFFLRHWDGGPHLRLRLRGTDRRAARCLRAHVSEHCAMYLRNEPADRCIENSEYCNMAERFATWEGVTDYRTEMYPNNSIRFIPYHPEHARYGSGRTLEAVERHFGEASRMALAVLRERPSADGRRTAAFGTTVLAWLEVGRMPRVPDGPGIRAGSRVGGAAFAGHYERRKERLGRFFDDVLSRAEAADRRGSVFGAWRRSVRELWSEFSQTPPPAGAGVVVDVCTHLMCNRLGLTLQEEQYIRYLAWRTVRDAREGCECDCQFGLA